MKLNFFQKVWAMYQVLDMQGREFDYVATDATLWSSKRLNDIEERIAKLEKKRK